MSGFFIWEKMETLARKSALLVIVDFPKLYEVLKPDVCAKQYPEQLVENGA